MHLGELQNVEVLDQEPLFIGQFGDIQILEYFDEFFLYFLFLEIVEDGVLLNLLLQDIDDVLVRVVLVRNEEVGDGQGVVFAQVKGGTILIEFTSRVPGRSVVCLCNYWTARLRRIRTF